MIESWMSGRLFDIDQYRLAITRRNKCDIMQFTDAGQAKIVCLFDIHTERRDNEKCSIHLRNRMAAWSVAESDMKCVKSYLRSICSVKGVLSGNLLRHILLMYQSLYDCVCVQCLLTYLF